MGDDMGMNNYTGGESKIDKYLWDQYRKKCRMESDVSSVKKSNKKSFEESSEVKEIWQCECPKCFYRFDCKEKHNRYYCPDYMDSSIHDKNVINEFAKRMIELSDNAVLPGIELADLIVRCKKEMF